MYATPTDARRISSIIPVVIYKQNLQINFSLMNFHIHIVNSTWKFHACDLRKGKVAVETVSQLCLGTSTKTSDLREHLRTKK